MSGHSYATRSSGVEVLELNHHVIQEKKEDEETIKILTENSGLFGQTKTSKKILLEIAYLWKHNLDIVQLSGSFLSMYFENILLKIEKLLQRSKKTIAFG